MNDEVRVAVLQAQLGAGGAPNLQRIETLAREAAAAGAQVVLPPELFEHAYFPKRKSEEFFSLASTLEDNAAVKLFRSLAAELSVVAVVSFFECRDGRYYNSAAMVDADGTVLGVYRKSHIPEGPGYEEKFYFSPGEQGFRVWNTCYARIGLGICWDQWFPECARAMALEGAELLLYPSAIGSEPTDPALDTRWPWQRVMCGHAVANSLPLAAANHIGNEEGQIFYGHSFIADQQGSIVSQLDSQSEGVAVADFNLAEIARYREDFGLLRDRRPELYSILTRS